MAGEALAEEADRALVAAVARGDAAAHARLFRAYQAPLTAFARRLTGRADVAEEVAADALHVLWRRADAFEGRARVSTWLHAIAYRIALQARARTGRRGVEVEADEEIASGEDGAAAVEAAFERRAIARALARLTPEHRQVIELTYYQGLGCEEAAAAIGCPVGTVKTRMMHARARLRRLLDPEEGEGAST